MQYELVDLENSIFDSDDFKKKINLGQDRFYYVLCDNMPYIKVEVNLKKLFDNAVIYNKFLLIGTFDEVYFINLENLKVTSINIDMYFGYFVTTKNAVYILDGTGIIAFDTNLNEIWRNHTLAVDGVVFCEIVDETMIVSCEIDPPGNWVDRKIDIKSGNIIY